MRHTRTKWILALLLLSAGGCYKRTIATHGIGSYGSATQKPYRSDTAADRALDSALKTKKTTTRTKWVETNK